MPELWGTIFSVASDQKTGHTVCGLLYIQERWLVEMAWTSRYVRICRRRKDLEETGD